MPAKSSLGEPPATLRKRARARAQQLIARGPVTRGQKVIDFIEDFVVVPEGMLVGQPMVLLPEQKSFVRETYDPLREDGKRLVRRAILSEPRKNGKTGLTSALLLAHLVGPEAKVNSQLYSAARAKEQAALVFTYTQKSIGFSRVLSEITTTGQTAKTLLGLPLNTKYKALSAEAKLQHGLLPEFTIHDELGQVVGPVDPLYDALETAGGASAEPLTIIISTQAATSKDLLSLIIDAALKSKDPRTVCHLYAAPPDADIFDEEVWKLCNFALGHFRSWDEMRESANRAHELPSFEPTFRNLYLNQRSSTEATLFSEKLWDSMLLPYDEERDEELFRSGPVYVGLDLSARIDLTAALISVQAPDERWHTRLFSYTPKEGIAERAKVDRVPYELYVKQGWLIAVPGRSIDYKDVVEHLSEATAGMEIAVVSFDRWRIDLFKNAAKKYEWAAEARWDPVGQGYKDMSPRIELLEELALNSLLVHSEDPIFKTAALGAVATRDPAHNRKLDKAKSTTRIDPIVALALSIGGAYIVAAEKEQEESQVTGDSMIVW